MNVLLLLYVFITFIALIHFFSVVFVPFIKDFVSSVKRSEYFSEVVLDFFVFVLIQIAFLLAVLLPGVNLLYIMFAFDFKNPFYEGE